MARVPAGVDPSTLHIAARRVLLDSLSALRAHHHAIVVVGAQAVYARSEDAPLRVAPFTADADLGLDPRLLGAEPLLEAAMVTAGFERGAQPGIWQRPERVDGVTVPIAVDLLVPASFAGVGRRAAEIPPHERGAARKVLGLEPSTVDHDPLRLMSLEPERDDRQITVNVAGVAALLVAKAFKISDRLADPRPGREADKDAGDVLRLMMTSDVAHVVTRFTTLLAIQV